jgi:hypothetical protein
LQPLQRRPRQAVGISVPLVNAIIITTVCMRKYLLCLSNGTTDHAGLARDDNLLSLERDFSF